MPENFANPFASRNIADLWTRWHRTLGFWIRDYLFTPIFRSGVARWPDHGQAVVFAAYLVAFTLAGIWHGTTSNFLVFGLLNGMGVCCAKIWELLIIRVRGRAGLRVYLQSTTVKTAAVVVTLHYFFFTLVFWSLSLDESLSILSRFAEAVVGKPGV